MAKTTYYSEKIRSLHAQGLTGPQIHKKLKGAVTPQCIYVSLTRVGLKANPVKPARPAKKRPVFRPKAKPARPAKKRKAA